MGVCAFFPPLKSGTLCFNQEINYCAENAAWHISQFQENGNLNYLLSHHEPDVKTFTFWSPGPGFRNSELSAKATMQCAGSVVVIYIYCQ